MLIADRDARYLRERTLERRNRESWSRDMLAILRDLLRPDTRKVSPFMSRTDANEIARPKVTTAAQVSYTEAADEVYRVRVARQYRERRERIAEALKILPEDVRVEFTVYDRHRLYGQVPECKIHTNTED